MDPLLNSMGLRGFQLCGFWGGQHWLGIISYILVAESSSLFYVLECLYKFVFDFGGFVLVENSVGVGVFQKCQSFVGVVWFVHVNHGHPLSAVTTIPDVSSLTRVKACHSSIVKLGLMWVPWFLRILLVSDLNSSTSLLGS